MGIDKLKKFKLTGQEFTPTDFNRFQQNVDEFSQRVSSKDVLDGELLTASLSGGVATNVDHGLGRQPLSYIICEQDTAATIFNSGITENTITLTASIAVNVKIWVF